MVWLPVFSYFERYEIPTALQKVVLSTTGWFEVLLRILRSRTFGEPRNGIKF